MQTKEDTSRQEGVDKMAWEGYLFKALKTNEVFPETLINYGSWSGTPNQREELKAWREDNSRDLHRITAQGRKSIFSFKTRKYLHLADKLAIISFFDRNEEPGDKGERKIHLRFWNDETNDYGEGWFYRPNMPFKIVWISDTDIKYDELDFEFIQY